MFLVLPLVAGADAEKGIAIVFIEPVKTQAGGASPLFKEITDASLINRYHAWMENDAARWALKLFQRAWEIRNEKTQKSAEKPVYYVAIVPEGNEGKVGFRLLTNSGEQSFANRTYIELDPDEEVFKSVLLHETGHMILATLNGGKQIPSRKIAAIPHTTAALTDRGTAFDEGFAIHLETLAAHFLNDPFITDRYNHRRFRFGVPSLLGEYHRIAGDLLSYSQTSSRYANVRDNHFAFAPAFKGADYFRTQLEKGRDFSELRNPNQLLQSEGFYATFFFSYTVRGDQPPVPSLIDERQTKMLETLAGVLGNSKDNSEEPFLLDFVNEFRKKYPEEGREVLDVLLDLSHGIFVDRDAAILWHEHYLGALRLDPAEMKNERLETARAQWRSDVSAEPNLLYSRLGPQLAVEVPSRSVDLVAFEEHATLSFDLNTVEEGVMRLIPGITEAQIQTCMRQRELKPFETFEDFKKRCSIDSKQLKPK